MSSAHASSPTRFFRSLTAAARCLGDMTWNDSFCHCCIAVDGGMAYNMAAKYFYGATTTLNPVKGRPKTPEPEPVRVPTAKDFAKQIPLEANLTAEVNVGVPLFKFVSVPPERERVLRFLVLAVGRIMLGEISCFPAHNRWAVASFVWLKDKVRLTLLPPFPVMLYLLLSGCVIPGDRRRAVPAQLPQGGVGGGVPQPDGR